MGKSDKVEIRVTRRSHTFGGKVYGPGLPDGDTFMGTQKMLDAMPDRMEPASLAKAREEAGAKGDSLKAKLEEAEKGRDLYKDAADKAQAELGEVKAKLAEAEAKIEELTAPKPAKG